MNKILIFFLLLINSIVLEAKPIKQISLLDENIRIDGLVYWDENKPNLYRLPKSKKLLFSKAIWRLGTMPSGGVISFRTDSSDISLKLDNPQASQSTNLTRIAKIGIDLYVNNKFKGNFVPNKKGIMDYSISFNENKINDIKLYLPLYEKIKIDAILLNKGAKVLTPKEYTKKLPIVFYGSSITQGSSASNPGLSFPAMLSRKLDVEMVNLGFSGKGLAQAEIIKLIKNIKASMFIIDFWANPNPKLYKQRLQLLIKAIRDKDAVVPIVVTSPIYNIGREKENYEKYNISKQAVQKFQKGGGCEYIFS